MRVSRVVSIVPAVCAAAALTAVVSSGQTQAVSQTNQLTPEERRAGWILLFDGATLDGWRGYKQQDATSSRWKAVGGLLAIVKGDGKDTRGQRDIISKDTYDSFELTWEWKVAEGGNSGLKYFVLEDQNSAIGHEYQLIDDDRHPDAKVGARRQTAALYDVLPASNRPLRPAGQFNQSRVIVDGRHVEHWLNGTKVLEYELESQALKTAIAASKFKDISRFGTVQKGHILIQDHGDEVWYRNVKIRPRKTS